ncbi:MAG TPA: 4Fe-4S dicluster domain-containing protein [Planctomycetota bacterium]|nr:4Fe-4S dicluster domain-containing protein [Planctomycetota bacterium]
MDSTINGALQQAAAQLLTEGKVGLVIGYGRANGGPSAAPAFVRRAEDAERLLFDATCFANLAVYLAKKDVRDLLRGAASQAVGVVVKGCDLRAVNVLLREHVVERSGVVLIGVRCPGVGEPLLSKCTACDVHEPQGCDVVVGEAVPQAQAEKADRYPLVAPIEEMPLDKRWAYWEEQLGSCIRCYACRQACPLCYCRRCIVEKSSPQWVETSAHLRGNLAWNAARALHLTGRCVGCGECERVCPMHLPLSALNQKMAKLVEERYGFRSGLSAEETAPFSAFAAEDTEEGIL